MDTLINLENSTPNEPTLPKLSFTGNSKEYLALFYTNLFLSIVTVGFYYPWAKVKSYKFFFYNTKINDTGFQFHGKGSELIKGFLLFLAFIIIAVAIIGGIASLATFLNNPVYIFVAVLLFYVLISIVFPFALHRRMKYLTGKTTWRGVQLGFDGKLGSLYKQFYMDIFLCLITFGIYIFWLRSNLIRYRISNIKFGNIGFIFRGDGSELFFIMIMVIINMLGISIFILLPIGLLLNAIGLQPQNYIGILYAFLVALNPLISLKFLLEFYINNTLIVQNEHRCAMYVKFSTMDILKKLGKTAFLTLVTLGIYAPVFAIDIYSLFINAINIKGTLDLDNVQQTQNEYEGSAGETIGDFLDIDIV